MFNRVLYYVFNYEFNYRIKISLTYNKNEKVE